MWGVGSGLAGGSGQRDGRYRGSVGATPRALPGGAAGVALPGAREDDQRVDDPRSPYAVPLTELESTRVPADEQVTLVPDPRHMDVPAWPALHPFGDGLHDGDGD